MAGETGGIKDAVIARVADVKANGLEYIKNTLANTPLASAVCTTELTNAQDAAANGLVPPMDTPCQKFAAGAVKKSAAIE